MKLSFFASLASLGLMLAAPACAQDAPSAQARAADLISKMTLEEKAGQMINHAPAIPRFGVSEYDWWSEALHGVISLGHPASVFPEPVGLAASFDPDLVRRIGEAVAVEGRANHEAALAHGEHGFFQGLNFYAPNINLFRDPRWGRGQETYGEDPYLTARMGVAYIRGLQGDDAEHLRVAATAKHFAVHSGPEPERHRFDAVVSAHDLEDSYLPAFRAAVEEGKVASVMCSYNAVNGVPACANADLLDAHLRKAWGFTGFVASDCDAVRDIFDPHHYAADMAGAAAAAVKAGLDAECLDEFSPTKIPHSQKYVEAVQRGLLSEKDLDRALTRSFTIRYRLGLFDEKIPASTPDSLESPAHRQLALEAARETLVLLKNKGILPLRKDIRSLAVVGPLATETEPLLGNYNGHPAHAVSVLEGLQKALPGTVISFEPGANFPEREPGLVPQDVLFTQSGEKGLLAEALDAKGGVVERHLDSALDHHQPAAPGSVMLRWTGLLTPNESGIYGLGLHGDANRLYLDGKLIVDETQPHPPETKTAEVRLEAGHAYALRVESVPGLARNVQLVWSLKRTDVQARAVAVARNADAIIAVVGITPSLEGEEKAVDLPGFKGGDRTRIDLPEEEQALLEALKATGKPLVVVLINGSALSTGWARANADALLEAWYPGEEGGTAVADVLSGAYNPSGRMPVTVYKGVEQLPPFTDYAMAGRTYRYFQGEPLFRFGEGMSYAHFAYEHGALSQSHLEKSGSVEARVEVVNDSAVAGDEVVQLYIDYPALPGAPIRALKGFRRIRLAPGERRSVSFILTADDFSHVDPQGVRKLGAGTYRLSLGGGQPADGATGMSLVVSAGD